MQIRFLSTAQVILHALSLCSCFCLPTVGSSEQVYFQHSVLSRHIKTNFHSTGLRLGQNGHHVLTRKEGAKLFNLLCSHLPAIARNGTFYRGIILFPVSLFVDECLEIFGTFGVCICVCVCVYTYVYVYVLCTSVCMHACMYCICLYVCVAHLCCFRNLPVRCSLRK